MFWKLSMSSFLSFFLISNTLCIFFCPPFLKSELVTLAYCLRTTVEKTAANKSFLRLVAFEDQFLNPLLVQHLYKLDKILHSKTLFGLIINKVKLFTDWNLLDNKRIIGANKLSCGNYIFLTFLTDCLFIYLLNTNMKSTT